MRIDCIRVRKARPIKAPATKSRLFCFGESIELMEKLRETSNSRVDTKLGHKKNAPSNVVVVT